MVKDRVEFSSQMSIYTLKDSMNYYLKRLQRREDPRPPRTKRYKRPRHSTKRGLSLATWGEEIEGGA